MNVTPGLASRFARIALGHVRREYPNKLDHVMAGADDLGTPRALHPIFYGSYDWHSCVHSYWLLLRVRALFPESDEAAAIGALLEEMLTPENVAGELAYLERPQSAGFERPYGWAWLLALAAEANEASAPWSDALRPLADAFAARFESYLPKLGYPIRAGTHFNTAFALIPSLWWCRRFAPGGRLERLLEARARAWYLGDADAPAIEPGGDDFLSPTLVVACLMKRVLGADEFADWFARYLPRIAEEKPASLFAPAPVSDRSDGKIAHLDGLNFTRAWCWRELAGLVGEPARVAADRHIAASLPHIEDDYMGSHWLCTFALLALGTKDGR